MNRRDALAALVALPEVTRIAVAQPRPGAVLVVETDRALSPAECARISQSLGAVWPGRRVVVLDGGLRLRIVEDAR